MTMVSQAVGIAMGFPGVPEMLIVMVVVLVLFGGAKLPSLMRNLGRSANEFKRGMSDSDVDDPETRHEKTENHSKHDETA